MTLDELLDEGDRLLSDMEQELERTRPKPRVPVVLERIGRYRKHEDFYTFQVIERLDTGRTRTWPWVRVQSPWSAAMDADVSDLRPAEDRPELIERCPILRVPIVREPDRVVYDAVDSPTRDILRSNKFTATRLAVRFPVPA